MQRQRALGSPSRTPAPASQQRPCSGVQASWQAGCAVPLSRSRLRCVPTSAEACTRGHSTARSATTRATLCCNMQVLYECILACSICCGLVRVKPHHLCRTHIPIAVPVHLDITGIARIIVTPQICHLSTDAANELHGAKTHEYHVDGSHTQSRGAPCALTLWGS